MGCETDPHKVRWRIVKALLDHDPKLRTKVTNYLATVTTCENIQDREHAARLMKEQGMSPKAINEIAALY